MNEEMPSCKFTFKVQCSQTGEWIDMACGHKFGGKCTCGDEAEIKKNRKRELQIKLADLDIRYERVIKEMTGATPVATYDRLRLLAREILDIVNKLKELEEKED